MPQPLSLMLAARQFGDSFVVWVRRNCERHLQETAAAKRAAHAAQFKADYLRYLLAAEGRLQEQDPARYRAFLDHRERQRSRLVRFARSGSESALMRGFETEAARLENFRAFFADEVLDFAHWDVQYNRRKPRHDARQRPRSTADSDLR
jgi:hypothetical protein